MASIHRTDLEENVGQSSAHCPLAYAGSILMPRYSLIVCTIGRTIELENLLSSLLLQERFDFEVIVVDQNEDDHLMEVVSRFQSIFPILRLRCPAGLSRARNFGLTHATGEIIAFPDDDCWYAPGLLRYVDDWFIENPAFDILAVGARDESGVPSGNRWFQDHCNLHPVNIFRTTFSSTLFLRHTPELRKIKFDCYIGAGSGTGFGSGEETDYILQLMSLGARGRFDRRWYVGHPCRHMLSSSISQDRALSYGRGMGYVLRKHGLILLWSILLIYDVLRIPIAALRSDREAVLLCISHARGLFTGFAKMPVRAD